MIVCKTFFLLPNLIAFTSEKKKHIRFFDYHLLTCSVRKMVLMCLMQNIDMCLLHKSHQIARLVSHIITSPNEYLPRNKKMLLNLVPKMKFYTIFISLSDFLCLYYCRFVHNFIWFELYREVEAILW